MNVANEQRQKILSTNVHNCRFFPENRRYVEFDNVWITDKLKAYIRQLRGTIKTSAGLRSRK